MKHESMVKVWDPLVRIFHWTLVVAFTIAYFTAEEESAWHIYSGYTVLGLVLFRILWGFVGTRYARFTDFVYGPARTLHFLRSVLTGNPERYLGHNPLGGLMILAMLFCLLAITYSGLVIYAIEEDRGPMAGLVQVESAVSVSPVAVAVADEDDAEDGDEAREEYWEEVHEVFTNITLFLILLHVTGVVVGSISHRENLVRAMFTGRKPADR